MPYCAMFDRGIFFTTNGEIKPCCVYEPKSPTFRIGQVDEARSYFQKKKKELEKGWIDECINCRLAEKEKTANSIRYRINKLNILHPGNDLAYVDMDIHNTCNLACRMCGPHSSSTWQNIVNKNPDLDWDLMAYGRHANQKYGWHKDIDEEIYPMFDSIRFLKFTGGEPFMIPQMKKIIQYAIDNDYAKNITYNVTTNATFDMLPTYDMLKKFKNVNISISIDATHSRYEYIRPGSNWNTTSTNTLNFLDAAKKHNKKLQYDHTNIGIVPTLHMLSVSTMEETKQWCNSNDLELHPAHEVVDPDFLTFGAMKPRLRKKFRVESEFEYNPDLWDKLCKQMEIQDSIHGTNFKNECPELF